MSLNTILATAPLTTTNFVLKATGTTIGNSLIWDNGTNVGINTTTTTATLTLPLSTTNSQISTGSLELQSYAVNNSWIGDNLYFDGSFFKARNNGYIQQIYFNSNGSMGFATNSTIYTAGQGVSVAAKMTILTSGNVGIGTTNPQAALHITGAIDAAPAADGVLLGVQSEFAVIHLNGSASTGSLIDFSTNGSDRKGRIEYSNVTNNMIFSTNASQKLTISSTGVITTTNNINMTGTNAQLLQTTANSVAGDNVAVLYNSNANSYGMYIGAGSGTNHALYITDSTRNNFLFKVQGNGHVGIGVNPSAWANGTTALQIGTAATLWNRASDNLLILGSNSYFNGTTDIQITTGTSNRIYFVGGAIYFDKAASTAAGSSTPWSQSMVISNNGSIGAPSGTNIYNASDLRLKQNITKIEDGLTKIISLNPIKFNWLDGFEESEDGKDMLGFIAQEVQNVIPEAVESFGNSSITIGETIIDNPLTVNEKFIIPVLVKAMQEQNALITSLQEQINELKNK
jgi:hypothetical protein